MNILKKIIKLHNTFFFLIMVLISIALIFNLNRNFSTLDYLTLEDGPIENLSALFLFLTCITSFYGIFKKSTLKLDRFFFTFIAILFFWAAGEEISWGQRVFNFKNPEFFSKYNVQQEFNFHNLISGTIFGILIYGSTYSVIWFSCIIQLKFKISKNLSSFSSFFISKVPPLPITFILIYGMAISRYSPEFFSEYLDHIAQIITIILFLLIIKKHKLVHSLFYKLAFPLLIFLIFLLVLNSPYLSYYNLQSEVREMIIAYGLLGWVLELIQTNNQNSKL